MSYYSISANKLMKPIAYPHKLLYLLPLLSLPAVAEVTETLNYKTYTAEHKAGTSLLETLNATSPIRQDGKVFHGHTSWNVQWRYRWNEGPNGRCALTENKTTVSAEITLPLLVSSDAKAKLEFSSYSESLLRHELGHLEIAQAVAKRIDERILSLPPMNSCALLEQTANQLGQRLLEEAGQEERNYDLTTGHGRTQGA